MADVADVENAIKSLLVATAYPSGLNAASITEDPYVFMRGWPIVSDVDVAMSNGTVLVSIYGQNNTGANMSRHQADWQVLVDPVVTVTMTVDPVLNTVTLGGTMQAGQRLSVVQGSPPGQLAAIYQTQPGDTLGSAAAGLAGLLGAAGVAVSASGPVLTFTSGAALQARAGALGTVALELARQERTFQVCIMCATPAQRDRVVPALDRALKRTRHLALADGTWGRMLFTSGHVLDERQTLSIYRRDVLCRVEFATIDTQQGAQVLVPSATVEITP